jgi:hypothetical protein
MIGVFIIGTLTLSQDGYKRRNQIVLPKSLRKAVLELAQDRPMSGHLEPGKSKQRVLQSFYLSKYTYFPS